MSWLDEALPILRVLIGDDTDPYDYCETRLADILVATAKLLVIELPFENSYVVTVSTQTISPDPTEDASFIPLLALKAATKVANSEYKAASMTAGSVSDGPSTINLGGSATALKARMEALQSDYEKAKLQYSTGNAVGCQVIVSECCGVYANCYIDGCFDYTRHRDLCY